MSPDDNEWVFLAFLAFLYQAPSPASGSGTLFTRIVYTEKLYIWAKKAPNLAVLDAAFCSLCIHARQGSPVKHQRQASGEAKAETEAREEIALPQHSISIVTEL